MRFEFGAARSSGFQWALRFARQQASFTERGDGRDSVYSFETDELDVAETFARMAAGWKALLTFVEGQLYSPQRFQKFLWRHQYGRRVEGLGRPDDEPEPDTPENVVEGDASRDTVPRLPHAPTEEQ